MFSTVEPQLVTKISKVDTLLGSALEFRSTVDRDTGSGDPARSIGRQESNYVGDILGLAESLQRLHS
jgi:hypothetical protein